MTLPGILVERPIGDKHAEYGSPKRLLYEGALRVYDEVVRAACRDQGTIPLRADAIGEVTDQIHRWLHEDDIVIADVSGANANVMYELGFRIGRGKPVILIGESGDLPFDMARLRTIRFRRTESSLHEARDQLSRVYQEGITCGPRSVPYVNAAVSGPPRRPTTETTAATGQASSTGWRRPRPRRTPSSRTWKPWVRRRCGSAWWRGNALRK